MRKGARPKPLPAKRRNRAHAVRHAEPVVYPSLCGLVAMRPMTRLLPRRRPASIRPEACRRIPDRLPRSD
eukprot:scaffold21750_cov128-Isochrysis_galbana.AAC.8